MKLGCRKHCGGLRESLNTILYIDDKDFNRLIVHYEFYGYDSRCKQILFISKNMKRAFTWLFIEFDDNEIYDTYRLIREKNQ